MSNATHETAPTEFVQVGGVRFAYRRFGRPGDFPLLLLNHLAATLDDWDPKVTNGLAADREVILFGDDAEQPHQMQGIGVAAIDGQRLPAALLGFRHLAGKTAGGNQLAFPERAEQHHGGVQEVGIEREFLGGTRPHHRGRSLPHAE